MERYVDANGDSSITAYESGPDYIRILFNDSTQYRYTYSNAGALNVERMKWLAVTGDNLKGYIDTYVRHRCPQIEA